MTIPFDPQDLKTDIMKRVVEFVANFEIYLEHVGDIEDWLKLIPEQLWAITDTIAYKYSNDFIRECNLGHIEISDYSDFDGDFLLEALAFALKVSWQRGYLMYRFYKYEHIPPPADSVDPNAIMNKMVSTRIENLSGNIEVFIQRIISFCTEEKPIRKALSLYGDSIISIVNPYIEKWAENVRSSYGFGVLCSKIEIQMETESMSKIEVNLGDSNTFYGDFVVAKSIEKSFNKVASADISDELKTLIKELSIAVGNMSDGLSKEKSEDIAEDLDALVDQATREQPKRKWWSVSVDGLTAAAKKIDQFGKPVLDTLARIVPLLEKISA